MQGQRSTVGPFPESFPFDHGSTSSSSAIDQEVYWNSMLNPIDAHNVPEYLLASSDTNTSYANVVSRDNGSLNGWNLVHPSSSGHALVQSNPDEDKMEEGWPSSLVSNPVTGPRSEEGQLEEANMLSLENVDISLNGNQSANGHLFLLDSTINDTPQNSNCNAEFVGNSSQLSEAGGAGYLLEEDDGRPGGSLDNRRLSGKRKNIEGVSGQSSLSGSPSCFQQSENNLFHVFTSRQNSKGSLNICGSSASVSGANPSEEQLNPIWGTPLRGSARECHDSFSLAGNAENLQRNPRMRINSAHQHDFSPNSMLSGNSIGQSNIWSSNQPSPLLSFNQSQETIPAVAGTTSQSQSHASSIPVLTRNVHPFPWNGISNPRIGSSSTSIAITEDRSATLREETSSRSIPGNLLQGQSMLLHATDMRYVAQDPSNWSLSNGNLSIPGTVASTSRVGSSSSVHPSAIPTWGSHQNPPSRHTVSLSEFVRQSFSPPVSSDSASQSNNLLPQRSGHPGSLHEMVHPPGTSLHGHQQSFLRPAFSMDRQNDVLGIPLSLRTLAASREGRSRVISEIRNALELMRRGENVRIEDVLILDQSVFYGGVDLHDRHRDMRLDVDNMSYEELLALEERIGYVSTGLNEEMVLKCLKQRSYLPLTPEASMEIEPCCICQEEYIGGEYLGTLDCGHDFHADCIKQWLMRKNMCPICKTTGLVT